VTPAPATPPLPGAELLAARPARRGQRALPLEERPAALAAAQALALLQARAPRLEAVARQPEAVARQPAAAVQGQALAPVEVAEPGRAQVAVARRVGDPVPERAGRAAPAHLH